MTGLTCYVKQRKFVYLLHVLHKSLTTIKCMRDLFNMIYTSSTYIELNIYIYRKLFRQIILLFSVFPYTRHTFLHISILEMDTNNSEIYITSMGESS